MCPSYAFPPNPGAFPQYESKYLSLETLNSVYPYLILRLTALHTNNKSRALSVIYNIGAISHLLQEIKRQRKREGGRRKKKSPTQHVKTCVRFRHRQGHPLLVSPQCPGLETGSSAGRRQTCFLSQWRCPLGLHAHCVNNTSLFLFISLVFFYHKTLLFLWKNSRSCA